MKKIVLVMLCLMTTMLLAGAGSPTGGNPECAARELTSEAVQSDPDPSATNENCFCDGGALCCPLVLFPTVYQCMPNGWCDSSGDWPGDWPKSPPLTAEPNDDNDAL